MDSAPSSSVVGIQTGNGSGSGAHGHLNSSGLKIIFAKNRNTYDRGVFSTGAMGALAPAILKNKLLPPAIFGHFSTVGKNCEC